MLRVRDEQADVVQHSRSVQYPGVFFAEIMQGLKLIEQAERQLAYVIGMRNIAAVLLKNLLDRLGAFRFLMPRRALAVAPAQEIDHDAVAQAALGDKEIIELGLVHNLMQHESAGDDDVGAPRIAAD